MTSTPSLPSSGPSSEGRMPRSNHSAMFGRMRSRTNARTVSRIRRSSSVKSASMSRKSAAAGSAGRDALTVVILPFENARDLVEERLHRSFVGVFEPAPQQTPFGVVQRRLDPVLNGRLFCVSAQEESVRSVESLVLNAPHDAFFRNDLLQHRMKAVMPFLGPARHQGAGRAHEGLRGNGHTTSLDVPMSTSS